MVPDLKTKWYPRAGALMIAEVRRLMRAETWRLGVKIRNSSVIVAGRERSLGRRKARVIYLRLTAEMGY